MAPAPCCSHATPCAPIPEYLTAAFDRFAKAVDTLPQEPGGMGEMEDAISQEISELLRRALELSVQAKANGSDHSRCPVCRSKLSRVTAGHERTVRSLHGDVTFTRSKGYCPECEEWFFPADHLLDLEKRASASPGVQRASALLVSKMPSAEAEKVMRELTGMRTADDSSMAREAQRQGERAKKLRDKMDEEACDSEGRWKVTARLREELGQVAPFTLVIQMDAVLIRERDDWGLSDELRDRGENPSRWHWVYVATIYRLSKRAETQSGRSMILSRGFVATREGLESFTRQVYAEAVRQGLLLAQNTLVIADGGVWIWKIADDRFPKARKRLDFFHASQHLHTIAAIRFGEDKEAAKKWIGPMLHQLKHGGEAGVVQTIADLADAAEGLDRDELRREAQYFRNHADHLDYAAGAAKGEPIGSGAIEST